MKKAGFIVSLISIILDGVLSLAAIVALSAIDPTLGFMLLLFTSILLVPMIVGLVNVNKNSKWAIAFVLVGCISLLISLTNTGSLPLIALGEIIGGILILTDKE